MAHDASQILGSPQLAGVKVNPRGFGKQTMRKFGGAGGGGGAVGAVSAGATQAIGTKGAKAVKEAIAESRTPQFGVLAWLAVTANELALVALKRDKGIGVQVQGVIERVPLGVVASARLGRGVFMAPPLTISFTDGNTWQLEVPPTQRRRAKNLVRTLEG